MAHTSNGRAFVQQILMRQKRLMNNLTEMRVNPPLVLRVEVSSGRVLVPFRCRANLALTSKSRPDSGLGFQV